ncbi:hypothetical protein O1611_g8556 [Lasiodiplodia mahajangana]|uniref:Uncharacterized protein n=1 Tax=Lasiodiplodia mahajangana TaxID=1108764 RepID=A0ACC2JC93_9PEZI|nr:hypothetical protein O1611_g8556 [Lasiodiplodia mahajangana]
MCRFKTFAGLIRFRSQKSTRNTGKDIPPDFFAPSFFGIVLESRNLYAPWDLTEACLRPSTTVFVLAPTPAPILSCANTSCTCRSVGEAVDLSHRQNASPTPALAPPARPLRIVRTSAIRLLRPDVRAAAATTTAAAERAQRLLAVPDQLRAPPLRQLPVSGHASLRPLPPPLPLPLAQERRQVRNGRRPSDMRL